MPPPDTPVQPVMTTKRVRIAVAIDAEGRWSANGYFEHDDERCTDEALYQMWGDSCHTAVVFVEADVPIPQVATIEGRVES